MILTRRVRIQLVIFVLLSMVGIVYAGLEYVGVRPLNPRYQVTAYFANSGGIFTNAAVDVRGVEAGQVSAMRATPSGVAVTLSIDPSFDRIAANSRAQVVDLSAVGEQFVNLVPDSRRGPYLHNGSVIPMSRTTTPTSDATIIQNLYNLVTSVDRTHLSTVIAQLGDAFVNLGPDLQRLIDQGDALTKAATQNLPSNVQLINDSKTVLDTQNAVSGQFRTFADELAKFSQTLAGDDPAINQILHNGIGSSQQLAALFSGLTTPFGTLLANLTTLSQIQLARLPGLKVVLSLYPADVANGFLASPGDGTGHFGLILQDPAPVCTKGYIPASQWRNNTLNPATSPQNFGGPANLNTYCLEPHNSQITVRGARNAPRPPGDTTAGPEGPATTSTGSTGTATTASASNARTSSVPSGVITAYDPLTGLLRAPNGQSYQLGTTGGEQQLLGPSSWRWLILSPAVAN